MSSENNNKEDLCLKCGRCCYIKTKIAGISVFTNKHCCFLDTKTNLCTVYKDRFKKNIGCLTVQQAIELRALPSDCPYVKDIYNYQGPKK